MGVLLTDFEQAAPFAGDYAAALAQLQERIARVQLAQIVHGSRSIILFDGWHGSGKKGALKALVGALDPCRLAVHCADPSDGETQRHWLAPYWSRLPRPGETAVFYRSWYSDAVARRAAGGISNKAWARTCDEINEFEAQQTDHGTPIVKLFFHVTAEVQAKRLLERRSDPWLRALDEQGQLAAPPRESQLAAWTDLFKRCDTRWAKWTILAGADQQAANLAALGSVADALEKAVPADLPQPSGNVLAMVRSGAAGAAG